MRVLSSFCLVSAISGSAFGSFDLALVQAAIADSGTNTYRVHRYDPQNGISLGSFNIGPQSMGMAADSARGELYTVDVNGNLRTFNYSTGEMIGFRSIGIGGVQDMTYNKSARKLFFVNSSDTIRGFDLNSNVLYSAATKSGTNYQKVLVSSAGNLFAVDTTSTSMHRFSVTSGFGSYQSASSIAGGTGYGQMAISESVGGSNPYFLLGRSSQLSYHFGNGVDFFSGSGFGLTLTNYSDYRGATSAHFGTYVYGLDTAGADTVRFGQMDPLTYMMQYRTMYGVSGGARNVAMVLAPEPQIPVALGIGFSALLLRRRRRANRS